MHHPFHVLSQEICRSWDATDTKSACGSLLPFLILVVPLTKSSRERGGTVLCKDAELLKNRVLLAFRCITVEENITLQFPKFKGACVSEIGCRRCAVPAPRSKGEDIAKSNKDLAREEGEGIVKRLVAGTVSGLRFLPRDWLSGQICCKAFSCSDRLPWINARLARAVTGAGNQKVTVGCKSRRSCADICFATFPSPNAASSAAGVDPEGTLVATR
jgi:hypothetical protein